MPFSARSALRYTALVVLLAALYATAGWIGLRYVTIGHNVSSRIEVDAVMEQAARAGAVIVKPAHDTFWGGYAGYFQDPDAHLWEVAWNPQWVLQSDA